MTRAFKTYGGEDLSPEVDLTENLEWEKTEFSTRAYLGESSPSTFPVRDELGVISASGATYNIGTRNRMEITLDGQVLWKGRRAKMTSNRRIRLADRDRIHDINADDINKDLHGIVVDGWVRPSETDVARVQALGAAYLAGSPRATTNLDVTTLVPNTNTVTLPAHTYNRTSPIGVLQEIAGQANKNFFVTVDDELFWDTYDSTAYATTLSISDRPADSGADGPGSDPLCYFPQWIAGPPIEFDGTTWMSGARMFWGPGDTDYVEANDTSQANLNAHWMEILNDDQSTDASSAQRRLDAILARRYQGLTYHVAIGPMTDAHVKLLKPGHLINIKGRVIGAANSFIARRIVDLTISTPAPGQWFAFMTLDTPHRPVGRGLPAGPRPPSTGGPALIQDTGFGKSTTATLDIQVSVASGADAIYLAIQSLDVTNGAVSAPGVTWYPNYVNAGAVGTGSQAMTEVDFATHDTNHRLSFFRLLAPTQSGTATSSVRISDADTQKIGQVWVLSGVNQSTPESDTATNNGGASASSTVTITASGLVLDAAEWTAVNAAADLPDATAGQTEDSSQNLDNSFGLWDHAMGAGHSASTGTLTWTFTNSKTEWSAIAVAINTSTGGDGTPEPPGEASNGDTTTGVYAPQKHVHPPGIVSNTTPTVNDDSGDGHEVGLVWVDQTTDTAYVLVDDTVGSAVWQEIADADAVAPPAVAHGTFVMSTHRDSDKYAQILTSDDGITWDTFATATSEIARDPSLMHFDGKWWLAATDGPAGDTWPLRSSTDLRTWSDVADVDVSGIGTVYYTWAPEWFIDPTETDPLDRIHVFFAATTTNSLDGPFRIYEMHPTNRALTTWSTPVEVTGTSLPTDMIDAFVVYTTETGDSSKPYKMFYKENDGAYIELMESASLTSGYTVIEVDDWAGWKDSLSIEAPSVIKLDDGRWRIYFNENNGLNNEEVWYSESTDGWATWSARAAITTDNTKAHGTVIRLPGVIDHERDPHSHATLREDLEAQIAAVDPALSEEAVRDIGHWEVIVSGSAPPVAVTNEAEDDWLYGWVSG